MGVNKIHNSGNPKRCKSLVSDHILLLLKANQLRLSKNLSNGFTSSKLALPQLIRLCMGNKEAAMAGLAKSAGLNQGGQFRIREANLEATTVYMIHERQTDMKWVFSKMA